MASEIKVDTISEKTSAGGVTIDGLLIKDGGISGDVSLIGTTPTFTIGDAGAEDAALVFDGNAKDFYIALDDSADKLVIGEGSTVGTNSILTITDDSVTVGDAAAVDTKIVFDGNAQDYHIGLDDSADTLVLGLGSTLGTTPAMTVNSSQVVTFAQNPVFPDGGVAIADLDIDGGTDIGAAIVDADLLIIDDGAGGTNRKTAASRLKTYIGSYDATPAFWAYLGSDQTVTNEATTTIICGTETFDTDSAYNASTGVFTVPSGEGGTYLFTFSLAFSNTFDDDDRIMVKILTGGGTSHPGNKGLHQHFLLGSQYIYIGNLAFTVPLAAGDTLQLAVENFDDAGTNTASATHTYFAGCKLHNTNS